MAKLGKFAHGKYNLKNPQKYLGNGSPIYRSSWEWVVQKMCDEHQNIIEWCSEGIRIPYTDPLTGHPTFYVPDFVVKFIDKYNRTRMEMWEIKPKNQAVKESVGRSKYNQAQFIKNQAKWQVARAYCKQNGIFFRVISEDDIFQLSGKK
jgi:hypothetical protein